jgi:cyclic pyranopterin phosphate synthase
MVDVGEKPETRRVAIAEALVTMSAEALRRVKTNELAKGDALTVAKLAGIQAAKETSWLIPLCHPILLDVIRVDLALLPAKRAVRIEAEVATRGATGVEMEAMTAAAVAALTVYDMVKGVDRGAAIAGVRLLKKSGGRSGVWARPTRRPAAGKRPSRAPARSAPGPKA